VEGKRVKQEEGREKKVRSIWIIGSGGSSRKTALVGGMKGRDGSRRKLKGKGRGSHYLGAKNSGGLESTRFQSDQNPVRAHVEKNLDPDASGRHDRRYDLRKRLKETFGRGGVEKVLRGGAT